ncbi:6656_t:CDS:2 [Diversispora eburnea]|uniref:6656_t:CDS:1 n=1 Tax=Diversispora eburnea TaxID=1213867 RepID=A0A9N8Z4A4_9GLOM|nr:6656_t:CDS:2 [Diversispora eburnea]
MTKVEDVLPTVASTSCKFGTSTQDRDAEITETVENVPPLQKEQSISSGTLSKIWIKYDDSRPTRLIFNGEIVDDLIRAIKKELSPDLDDVAINRITLRRHGEEEDLDSWLKVDGSFENNGKSPLQVIVNSPESEVLSKVVKTIQEGFSQFKPTITIKASSLSENRARDLASKLGLTSLDFKDALNLPEDFHVQDVHNESDYCRHIPSANVTLTGGTDISIGPSDTPCVWVETEKKEENFKEEGKKQHLTSSKINNHGIALAIIKQFVLDEWKTVRDVVEPNIIYQTNLPFPLTKKIKLEHIPEEVDDRMSDVIDNMTEKELFNMSMRKRLKLAKILVSIEEQPIIDQFISQFSDDYENSSPLIILLNNEDFKGPTSPASSASSECDSETIIDNDHPYECNWIGCGKAFSDLTRHRRIHTVNVHIDANGMVAESNLYSVQQLIQEKGLMYVRKTQIKHGLQRPQNLNSD